MHAKYPDLCKLLSSKSAAALVQPLSRNPSATTPPGSLPDWIISNYYRACDALHCCTADESTGDLDPVYTVILYEDGLQNRIASGKVTEVVILNELCPTLPVGPK